MNNTNRRNFLKSSATVGAGITLTTQFNSTWAGIKEPILMCAQQLLVVEAKGSAHARHLKSLAKMGVRVTGACDPDTTALDRQKKTFSDRQKLTHTQT